MRSTSNPPTSAVPGISYRYDVNAFDPDGELLTYILSQAPDGMEIDELGRITWIPNEIQIGVYPIGITVTDSREGIVNQSFNVTVAADESEPEVQLFLERERVDIGESVNLFVSAIDNIGIDQVNVTVNGNPVPVFAQNQVVVEVNEAGIFEVVANVIDSSGNATQATTTLIGLDPN